MKKLLLWSLALTASLSFAAHAVTVPVAGTFHFRDNRGPNTTVLIPEGERLVIGVRFDGGPGAALPSNVTGVTAVNSNKPGVVIDLDVALENHPIFAPQIAKSVPFESDLAGGTWNFTVVTDNGMDAVAMAGPNESPLVPLVPSFTVVPNGGLTPTLNWVLPANPPGVSPNRIRVHLLDSVGNQFKRIQVGATDTSLTLQPGDLPGLGDYTFRLQLEDFGAGGTLGFARSSTFVNHQVVPLPAPLVLLVSGLLPAIWYRFRRTAGPR